MECLFIGKNNKKLLELTCKILNEYWRGNQKLLLNYMHPYILWIGSANSEYIHGAEAVKKRLCENKAEMPMVYLDEQEYEVVYSDALCCQIVGKYRAFTKPESGVLLSERQRISFFWVKDKSLSVDKIYLKHVHLSNVLKIQGEDECFPIREGKKNYYHMKKVITDQIMEKIVTDRTGPPTMAVFNFSNIAYLKADRNYTEFYANGSIRVARVRENISKITSELPEYFLQVSRSVLVNRNYVKNMKGKDIIMLDDMMIQVPSAKCALIRKALNK